MRTRATSEILGAMSNVGESHNDALSELAAKAAAGDGDALDQLLYEITNQRLVEPAVRRLLFDPNDVDDVIQNVLIAVAEKVGSFRGESTFSSWIHGVARNKALEHLRRKRDTATSRTDLGESNRISSMVAADVAIRAMLERLPEHYQQAVTLRDIDGWSYQDIADHLDLNLNTVRAHISRGRALLASLAHPPTQATEHG